LRPAEPDTPTKNVNVRNAEFGHNKLVIAFVIIEASEQLWAGKGPTVILYPGYRGS